MDLEKIIKIFNLIFTNTMKKKEFCRVDFDINEATVNYDNSISLYELIFSFNKLYNAFKKKYAELEKFNFCRHQYPTYFGSLVVLGKPGRILNSTILVPISKKSKNYKVLELTLSDDDGKFSAYVKDREHEIWDPDCYLKDLNIDEDVIKKYLDLFQEYNFLMELFYRLRYETIFSDGTYSIVSSIMQRNVSNVMFTEDVDTFKFSIFASYFDTFNEIIITLKLGDELSIDLDNSKIKLGEKKIDINSEMCFDILKKIYVNSKYLEDFDIVDRGEKGEQKRKYLQDNV